MKKKHTTSIFRRIFLPLLFMVLLQAAILYGIMFANGVFTKLNNSAVDLLHERTQNKQQNLLNNMINVWSNLLSTEDSIESIVQAELNASQKDWDDIATDASLNASIVEKTAPELISRLRNNRTTGIFLILDGICVQNDPTTYAGVYIRDEDPTSESSDNSDLTFLRGLPPLSRSLGISLDSFWKASFSFPDGEENSDNLFFFNPLNSAKESDSLKSQYFCYWSHPFHFGDSADKTVITYSLPLINSAGLVYGVVGIELSESYLVSQINDGQYANIDNYFYYLGVTTNHGKNYEKIISDGSTYKRYFSSGVHNLSNSSDSENLLITYGNLLPDEKLYGAVSPLQLYNNNTPFIDEQWVLIGLQNESSLFLSTHQFQQLVLISLFIALTIGTFVAIFASHGIIYPIISLVQRLQKSSDGKDLDLPHTSITEIDSLVDAITSMNQDIIASATRTSKLIELSGLPVGVYEVRNDPKMVYCSDGFFRLLNCEKYKTDNNLLSCSRLEEILKKATENPIEDNAFAIQQTDSMHYVRIIRQTDSQGNIGTILDVTKEILDKRKIEHERDYDSLTGIMNRRAFEHQLSYLLRKQYATLGIGALLMFDLDNLKFLNDSYGHDCGDSYIQAFAKNLSYFQDEHTLIARRSGDEFYLFLYGYPTKEELYKRIHTGWEYLSSQSLTLPDGSTYRIRVSGGISWYPDDSTDASQLIHYADFAMYQVKHSQKGAIQEFNCEDYSADSFLFNGHNALNKLIDEQLLRFMFQPIYSAKDGSIFGYELLMRSEVNELRTPDVILRMAKSQGKLHYIERLTWLKGLSDARNLLEHNALDPNAFLFVNSIANQTLHKEDEDLIVQNYKDLLPKLVLEVTEGEDNNMDFTNKKLSFVRSYGGQVAIDDFGTGYNSELALVMIPSDIVKIDISFVSNVDSDPDKQLLIKNLIFFAKEHGIAVLAEGVETLAEMQTLIGFGVDYLQGYYLARPQFMPQTLPEHIREEILECQK